MNAYYLAKCKLCGWQWSIRADERATAREGCPSCGVGSPPGSEPVIDIVDEFAPEGVEREERHVTFKPGRSG